MTDRGTEGSIYDGCYFIPTGDGFDITLSFERSIDPNAVVLCVTTESVSARISDLTPEALRKMAAALNRAADLI